MDLNIEANRRAIKYSSAIMLMRYLWAIVYPFYKLSPRPCFGWRRFLLRLFGAEVGKKVNIYNSATIYMPWNLRIGDWSCIGENALIYNLGSISIGEKTTISHGAHLCAGTHDFTDPTLPLLKPPITIGNQVWICADAFVGPGVTVGDGAVVGARAVALKDIDMWTVVGGNPARFIKRRILKSNESCKHES
jgi:putative colanic acid biosynthesis acetyltransferase WcaF